MPNSRSLALAVILTFTVSSSALAQNSIVVESRTFTPLQTACTVGVAFTNSVELTGIVLPLEFRTLTGGAYIQSSGFSRGLASGNRIYSSPLGPVAGCDFRGCWPAASITNRTLAVPDAGTPNCTSTDNPSQGWNTAAASPDGISPDAIFIATVSTGDPNNGDPTTLPPGSDPAGTANASYRVIFSTNGFAGCFVLDTTCIRPSGHSSWLDVNSNVITPSFTAGTICLECDTLLMIPPSLACHNDTAVFIGIGETGTTVDFVVTASDDCSDPTVVCDPVSGSFFPVGTTVVTCIATDDEDLADTCTFDITVAATGPVTNSITIESRTFYAGHTDCSVGVFISNVDPLRALLLELEARSTTGGFYAGPVGSTFFTAQTGRRVYASPLGPAGLGGDWPAANITSRRFAHPNANNTCTSPPNHSWSAAVAQVDGISPDAIEYATSSSGNPGQGDLYVLPPGLDPPTRDGASFVFRFDAGLVTGCFEIDTCCVTPANHTIFLDATWQPVPFEFTKGTICIECDPEANQSPQLDCPGVVRVTVSEDELGANVNYNSTALDDCSVPVVTCDPPRGSFFPIGTTSVTCIATDDQGAADTCTFDVIVKQGYPATDNSITVESKTFVPGQTDCQVGVYLSNVNPITGLVMILEARTIDGAFYTTSATNFFREQAGRRLDDSPLGTADVNGEWPAASTTRRKFDTVMTGGFCPWSAAAANVGGTSPDAVMHATVSTGDPNIGEAIALEPGADPPFTANASWLFTFNAGMTEGCFEIDTTCVQPAGHLTFVDQNALLITPSFTKGTICISSCICECHGNPANCANPSIDVLDVIYVLNVAFRGQAAIGDNNPACPAYTTDLNCDEVSDILDAVKIINVAFRGASAATEFCDPCP